MLCFLLFFKELKSLVGEMCSGIRLLLMLNKGLWEGSEAENYLHKKLWRAVTVKSIFKKKKLIHYQQLTIFSPTWHKEASNSYDHKNHYFSPLKSREKHKKSARFHNILSLKAILAWSLNYLTKQQKIEIFWSNEKETILTERKTMLQQLFKVM